MGMGRAASAVRTLAVAAVSLLGVLSPIASAATSGSLTVTVPGSAYVDLRFATKWAVSGPFTVVSGGKGHFVGVFTDRLQPNGSPYVERDGSAYEYANIHFKQPAETPDQPALGCVAPDCNLPPDLYRVYILSDGPVTLRVPLTGLDRNLRVNGGASVHPRLRQVLLSPQQGPSASGNYAATTDFPVTIGRTSVAFGRIVERSSADPVRNDVLHMCVKNQDCPSGASVPPETGLTVQTSGDQGSTSVTMDTMRGYYDAGPAHIVADCHSLTRWISCSAAVLDNFIATGRPKPRT
jgi:hypothetical protein